MLRNIFYCLVAFLISLGTHAQVVNGYAKVSNISGATLTLTNVNETADTFENDEWVVLMQMQGNVIGTTTDVIGFGSLGTIGSTGLYEIRQIDTHTESGGVPNTITLKTSPNFTYSTCTNCSVQIITFRKFGSPNYTTTANMSALPWNGNVGGVLAFYVDGTLTLAHNLSANETGFRGAATNGGGSTGCTGGSAYRLATGDNHADKGEGIYKRTNANYAAGRAHIVSGGGGGNSHNAGGGGGGNYTAGGNGGPGWPDCSPSACGIGGLSLSGNITVGRIFLGGGGGAGEGNDGYATQGKNGGGIILVKATEIKTVSCAGISITSNGGSVPGTGGNDGGGGGGSGGSIIFEVETWNIAGACPLTISANGGNGGNVNTTDVHGGGGGGGQGTIFFSDVAPTTNVTKTTNNGIGGCNNNTVPCVSMASPGGGTNGAGIFDIFTGPLPIELVEFYGYQADQNVALKWTTKSERNNAFFTIERSQDGEDWRDLATVNGAGNSSAVIHYSTMDFNPFPGLSYYRLRQTDFDGTYTISDPISIVFSTSSTILYPNPATEEVFIKFTENDTRTLTLLDGIGRTVKIPYSGLNSTLLQLDISTLPAGVYTLILDGEQRETLRFTVTD